MRKPKIVAATTGAALLIAAGITVGVVSAGADSGSAGSGIDYQNQFTVLRNAQTARVDAAVVSCMTKAGFTFTTPAAVTNPRNALTARQDLLTYGYGVNTAPTLRPAPDPNNGYLATLPANRRAAYLLALHGVSKPHSVAKPRDAKKPPASPAPPVASSTAATGCLAVSYDHYMHGLAPVVSRAVTAREHMYGQLAADPRMVEAYRNWSTCLAKSGHHYATLQEILDDVLRDSKLPGRRNSPKARAHELAIAKADSDCRDRHVEPTYTTVLSEYLTREAPNNQALLAEANKAVAQAR